MKRILNWIKLCFRLSKISEGISGISSNISFADKRIKKLQKLKDKSDEEIQKQLTVLSDLHSKITKEIEKTSIALTNAELLSKKLSAELEASQQELETANKILIPGLVAANQTMLDRWEHESAVYVMRNAAMGAKEIE